MNAFADHFSTVAAGYSEYRPGYPPQLFDALVSVVCQSQSNNTAARSTGNVVNELVWDCAAGTGQASVALGERFAQVFATDASVSQVQKAARHSRVGYAVATAEHCPLPSNSVSLLTVAQALHWFNVGAFFHEAKRVLVPGGILAVWCYGLLRVDDNQDVERVIDHFSEVTVGPWWPPERKHIDAGYTALPFPFERIAMPSMDMTAVWTRAQMLGYLRTWSAVSRKRAEFGDDPVSGFEPELTEAWGGDGALTMRWPLTVMVGR